MHTQKAELLYKHQLHLGEGACWHAGWKKFLYVDINGKLLGRIDPVTKTIEERIFTKKISAAFPAINDKLIVALEDAIAEYNWETGEVTELISVEKDLPLNRCNDGACDANGRLWIGTMNIHAESKAGSLYCLHENKLVKKISGTTVSNGICWSPDNQTMYYIDSFDYNIKAFDYAINNAAITNERIVVAMEDKNLVPDGMCADEEGMLWVAIWGGGCVNRYNPFTGKLIEQILIDAPHVTNCAFGNDDMQQLFITTAREGLSDDDLQRYPLSGSLFTIHTQVKGLAVYPYNNQIPHS